MLYVARKESGTSMLLKKIKSHFDAIKFHLASTEEEISNYLPFG